MAWGSLVMPSGFPPRPSRPPASASSPVMPLPSSYARHLPVGGRDCARQSCQQERAVLPGAWAPSLGPPAHAEGPADTEGVPPASVCHTHAGERWLGHRQLPSGSGDRVEKALPWFTFIQMLTCRVSRAVRPAGEDRGSQPDFRNQAYKVSSQKVSEGPSLVRREHPHEERARALETRGEGSRGQRPGPPPRPHRPGFTLSPDCDRSSGMPWTIPILCCGVTRPFHNQLPVTESWWQGHFHLPVTLAEMGMVRSWRGKRRQSQLPGRGNLVVVVWGGGGGWAEAGEVTDHVFRSSVLCPASCQSFCPLS